MQVGEDLSTSGIEDVGGPELDVPTLAARLDSPARNAAEVVPDDGADLAQSSRALFIGGAGDVTLDTAGGDTVTLTAATGFLPICAARVHATGTSATAIVALW